MRDSSVERLDLEHRIAAWKRQSRIAMLERHDFILENRKELPTRTFASVYQRRSKLYVEQCHRGEQARARKSEQIRQVEQKVAEKGLRDAKRLAEVQARRIEQIRLAADPARVSEQPGIAGANAVASDTATGQSLPRVRSGSRPGDGAEDISSPSRSSAIDDSSSTPSTPRGSEAESEGGASIEAPPPESSLRRELPDGSFEEENSTEEPAPAAWPTRRDEEEEELLARPEWEANSPPMSNLEGGLPLTRARSSGLSAGLESPLKFSGVAEELVAAEPLEGWLHKRGRAVKSVRRRYFVLGGEDLRYYEDESKASCKGEIPLSAQSRVLTANALNGAPAFALTYGPGENMIILAAEGSEERQRWMESLRNAVGRLETIRK